MAYDGRAIANFVLDFCEARKRSISNLALQKIVYFCHVWSLIRLNRPLVRHKFEAWEFGPVLPYLYREFKQYDRSSINGRALQIDLESGKKQVVSYQFDQDTLSLLEESVDFYSQLRAGDLVELSHVEGGPWFSVWNHSSKINPGMRIDDEAIRLFYSKIPSPFRSQ